jgi:hypothetical protein
MARRSTFALGFAAAMSQLLCALTGRGRTGLAVAALIVIVTACSSGSRQAPCPTNVPQSGSACPAEGATCGYLADASACEGSVDCDCDVGVWTGGPTCVVPPDCPADPPQVGAACSFGSQTCYYDASSSDVGGAAACSWQCATSGLPTWQAACPASLPEAGSACVVDASSACGYAGPFGECSDYTECACNSGAWICGCSNCTLGASCVATGECPNGVAGCGADTACQCMNGIWQRTCPADVPQTGSACTAAGAYCGYSNQPNPCGADNCYCQGGAWTCGPTCIFDAGASDAPAGG